MAYTSNYTHMESTAFATVAACEYYEGVEEGTIGVHRNGLVQLGVDTAMVVEWKYLRKLILSHL